MRTPRIAALACCTLLAAPLAMAQDTEWFKGKAKPGNYEYKMEMDMSGMPGMPAGMGKQNMTMQHCITQADIDKGHMSKGRDGKDNDCKITNMQTSGNSASYSMACETPRKMTADVKIAFAGDGYHMDMKMNMAESKSGQVMSMTQHLDAKYLGACTK